MSKASTARSLRRSAAWLARAEAVIPGASQTLSKGPTQWARGTAPAFLARGRGALVWDVDGNEYVDWPMALGPVLLGHAFPAVNDAVARQLADGMTFTLPHTLEVEVAEQITSMVPGTDRVRFAKSGSDATSAAVRVARAVTGRDRVIVAGYHGWHDWYVGSTSRSAGVPAATRDLVDAVAAWDRAGLAARLEATGGDVACVVLEPAGLREPAPGELQALVDLAHAHGALVVFDEVITGFRLAQGGAQERYGVRADLVAFGKALGNGMPLSALAGPAMHMDILSDVFFSGTHAGETLSLAAARATLDVLCTQPVHDHLWRLGASLQRGLSDLIAAHGLQPWIAVSGAAPWTLVSVREPDGAGAGLPAKTLLQQELLRRGVLFNGSHFATWSHGDEELARTFAAYDGALSVLAEALPDGVPARLEGPPIAPVFRPVR